MNKIAIVGIIILGFIFVSGCTIPGTSPDPITGTWDMIDPGQFNDTSFTYVFNADGTGNLTEIHEDLTRQDNIFNITWNTTGNSTYEIRYVYQLDISDDNKAFTISGDGSGDRFVGDGFIGIWTRDTPDESNGVMYEGKFAFYENNSGSFSWYYQNNNTRESSYPLTWSKKNGIYSYSYPDNIISFTLGTDGILTEDWDNVTYTYTKV
ncbi:MAG TPA: hypothetical protein VJ857_01580 [Methanocorpusculum sp.]|nr:hypothetical protein [Methanocorpusculum sp.]HKL97342.1 hypothetical protein [Methanocorpusculum sp.]